MGLMKSVVNPVMRLVLKSPLYRLIPGVMLITVTGRRSGRRYTTPVQYALDDGHVYVLTRAQRSWWRNIRGGAPVELRLRGRTRHGTAEAFLASADGAAPAFAAFRGSSLEREAGRLGSGAIVVAIELNPDDG
jgi:deazaflavin-dependent oxidoreductase (nitroreductase family)